MKILLVRPPRRKQAITLAEVMFSEPIGLECVYAVIKDEHDVRLVDLMVEDECLEAYLDWHPDVVGFTTLCIDVPAVKELARKVKIFDSSITVVVGGTQAVVAPESLYVPEIDHILHYTTRENLRAVFSNPSSPAAPGIISKCNGFKTGTGGFNEYIIPDRSITDRYRQYYSYFGYRPCAIMQTSQGCSAMCKFCMRWLIEGAREINRPLDEVIAQIREIQEEHIMIFDNDFLHSPARMAEFCSLVETYGIRKTFICYASVRSILACRELLPRLKACGLTAVLVGYETCSEAELLDYHKQATAEDAVYASELLRTAGVDCWASFILHPDWSVEDFNRLKRYIKKLRPQVSSLVPLNPFPGTGMYATYKDRLLFAKEDYDQWSFSLVAVRPAKLSIRRYYYEVLKANLYVNLAANDIMYSIRKFGFLTVLRLIRGSIPFLKGYMMRMAKS
jgi:hopanoid C-3 methylase